MGPLVSRRSLKAQAAQPCRLQLRECTHISVAVVSRSAWVCVYATVTRTGKHWEGYEYLSILEGLSQCSRLSMPRTHDSCDSADSIESISAHDALRAQTAVCPVQLGIGYCRYVAVAVQVPLSFATVLHVAYHLAHQTSYRLERAALLYRAHQPCMTFDRALWESGFHPNVGGCTVDSLGIDC